MSAIETLKAYRTYKNADNIDDAVSEIERIYERLDKQMEEIDFLRHDIERMQEIDSEHLAEIDRLLTENRMLTKALDRVAKSNGLQSWESLTDEDDKS